jgi:hypothetical protein
MLTLQVISHCWQYERALAFHLSALYLHPPATCRAIATVFYCPDDEPVCRALDYFRGLPEPPAVTLDPRPIDQPRLCRRAIGRNLAARETTADFVLFSDVDYLFGPGALDAAAAALLATNETRPALCHPRHIWQSIDHCRGDEELARASEPQLIDVEQTRYELVRIPRGIGGVQWVPGPWARERGYLPDSERYQAPADVWKRTYCDRIFRAYSGLPEIALDVPGMYRLRHSKRGRFDVGCRN